MQRARDLLRSVVTVFIYLTGTSRALALKGTPTRSPGTRTGLPECQQLKGQRSGSPGRLCAWPSLPQVSPSVPESSLGTAAPKELAVADPGSQAPFPQRCSYATSLTWEEELVGLLVALIPDLSLLCSSRAVPKSLILRLLNAPGQPRKAAHSPLPTQPPITECAPLGPRRVFMQVVLFHPHRHPTGKSHCSLHFYRGGRWAQRGQATSPGSHS